MSQAFQLQYVQGLNFQNKRSF